MQLSHKFGTFVTQKWLIYCWQPLKWTANICHHRIWTARWYHWSWSHTSTRYLFIHLLCLFLSFVKSSLLLAAQMDFHASSEKGVLELMEWGGQYRFQLHNSYSMPFCLFPPSVSAHPFYDPSCFENSLSLQAKPTVLSQFFVHFLLRYKGFTFSEKFQKLDIWIYLDS